MIKMRHLRLIILPISALLWTAFSFTGGGLGDADFHKELVRKTEEKNWEIVVGGNRVYRIDINRRKRIPIMSMAKQNKYIWSTASLSPDGQWFALERSPKRPPFKKDLILINWKDLLRSSKPFDELIEIPLPDLDIEGFAWAPDRHALAIKVRKEWQRQDQNRVYEFSLETKQLRLLPIEQIFYLDPNAWSEDNLLVFCSESNAFESIDAMRKGESLNNINQIALYDFNSNTLKKLFPGNFPTWNHNGLLTFMDMDDNNFYTYDLKSRERKLLLKNQEVGRGNGFIYGPIIWSPDDQYILYGRQSGFTGSSNDLYATEVATGRETLICRGVDMLFAGHASWVALSLSETGEVNKS